MGLKRGHPGKLRRLAGRAAVLSLVLGAVAASALARAGGAAASAAAVYDVAMTMSMDGAQASPRVLARGGEAFAVASDQGGARWKAEFTITKAGADTVWISGKIDRDSAPVARPTLQGRLGESIGLKVDDAGGRSMALTMVVREAPAPPAQP
jgi:hypothetical protein